MSEWWTYTLSDFLMFSPRTYYRLLLRHNAEVWPAQLVAAGAGVALVALLRGNSRAQVRATSLVLGLLWAWVGWAFLWRRYATINPAAAYGAVAFAVQAILLIRLATGTAGSRYQVTRSVGGAFGLSLLAVGLALYPALAPLSGRSWRGAELFGIAPDPTAIATLGLVLLLPGRARWDLLAVPVLWCSVSAATLWAMGSYGAIVPALSTLLALAAATSRHPALALPGPAPEN